MTRALDILLQHAEQARDQALTEWQQAQVRVRGMEQQAEQLLSYRKDTEARDPTRAGRSTGIDALLVHRSFMQRLQQAVDLQQQQLAQARLQAQALQADLRARELRVAQVQKLQQRRATEALREQDRQEQRRSDDAGQQRLHQARAQAAESAQTATATAPRPPHTRSTATLP
jgi:flagellar FliJ protein